MDRDGGKILVVDDEPYVAELLWRYLSREGYQCAIAHSGEEALRCLERQERHLVIADILMPGMSGIDLLSVIGALYPDVAVLMVTAINDKDTGIMAVELGAFGYIVKPFERNEILINVANALERRRLIALGENNKAWDRPRIRRHVRKQEPVRVSAKKVLTCISAGMDEAAIMKRFNLSAKALHSLYDQLVEAGQLTQSQVDRRCCISPGTVAIDLNRPEFPSAGIDKPVIKAADAVKCIRSGMDDPSLMKRYKISAKGLQSLFRKLVAAGVLNQSELNRRLSETHAWAILDEEDLQAHERQILQTACAQL